jgi:hypothetical protein
MLTIPGGKRLDHLCCINGANGLHVWTAVREASSTCLQESPAGGCQFRMVIPEQYDCRRNPGNIFHFASKWKSSSAENREHRRQRTMTQSATARFPPSPLMRLFGNFTVLWMSPRPLISSDGPGEASCRKSEALQFRGYLVKCVKSQKFRVCHFDSREKSNFLRWTWMAIKAAGVTPEIREAWPRDRGRTLLSFSLTSLVKL